MTLAELGMAFWHDLAAPVIAGTVSYIHVTLPTKRMEHVLWVSGCLNGNLRPDQAAGVNLCGLFRKKNETVASG